MAGHAGLSSTILEVRFCSPLRYAILCSPLLSINPALLFVIPPSTHVLLSSALFHPLLCAALCHRLWPNHQPLLCVMPSSALLSINTPPLSIMPSYTTQLPYFIKKNYLELNNNFWNPVRNYLRFSNFWNPMIAGSTFTV